MAKTSATRCAQKVKFRNPYQASIGLERLILAIKEAGKQVPPNLGAYLCNNCGWYHLGKNPARGRGWGQ